MKIGAYRGSHLPVLTAIIPATTGPVVELGMGFCSSPYLHWACYPSKRRLVSFENNPRYYDYARSWKADFHEVHCIPPDGWNNIDLSPSWAVAFVDHSPNGRRHEDIRCLVHADYVVIHDAENSAERDYHLSALRPLFKYRYKYTPPGVPYTALWSNKYDVRDFQV